MQDRRESRVRAGLGAGVAPLIVAGALLLSPGVPATAQEATPPAEVVAEEGTLPTTEDAAVTDEAADPTADTATDAAATEEDSGGGGGRENREGRGGQQDVAGVPSVGVGADPLGTELGAVALAVAAAAAGAAALRLRPSGR